ncbi:MAG: monovalent cation/H+ antiporter complex subunit F [Candidatus Omnitrophota bacterium]
MTKKTKRARWVLGLVAITMVISAIFVLNLPILFHQKLPHIYFFKQCFFILLLSAAFCLFRVVRGPTAADRIVAIDMLGILIVGFCAIIGIPTGRLWYIDIGIAWVLQSYIAALALSKYLGGKDLDE